MAVRSNKLADGISTALRQGGISQQRRQTGAVVRSIAFEEDAGQVVGSGETRRRQVSSKFPVEIIERKLLSQVGASKTGRSGTIFLECSKRALQDDTPP